MKRVLVTLLLSLALVFSGAGVSIEHCRHSEGKAAQSGCCKAEAPSSDEAGSCMFFTLEKLQPFSFSQGSDLSPWQLLLSALAPQPASVAGPVFMDLRAFMVHMAARPPGPLPPLLHPLRL